MQFHGQHGKLVKVVQFRLMQAPADVMSAGTSQFSGFWKQFISGVMATRYKMVIVDMDCGSMDSMINRLKLSSLGSCKCDISGNFPFMWFLEAIYFKGHGNAL